MSAISRRNRVFEVEQTTSAEPTITIGAVILGVIGVLGGALAGAIRSAGKDMPTRTRAVRATDAPARIAAASPVRLGQIAGLSAAEQTKVNSLLEIGRAPYVVSDATNLQPLIQRLCRAESPALVAAARRDLESAVRQQHVEVLSTRLVDACRGAALKVGFSNVELLSARGIHRVKAVDANGRLLVSEIRVSSDGAASIATETANISDGSCHDVLDAFEGALNRLGVRSSAPERETTGGVCQLVTSVARVQNLARDLAPPSRRDQKAVARRQQAIQRLSKGGR